MPTVGFEPTISAGEQPQTYALDRAAIGTAVNYTVMTELSVSWEEIIKKTVNSLIPCRIRVWSNMFMVFGIDGQKHA